MQISNVSIDQVYEALEVANKKFDDNLTWNREPEYYRGGIRCTIRVIDSRKPGAKLGYTGRRTIAACWHAQGDFMAALCKINPIARITSNGEVFNPDNWIDKNIGSERNPVMYSTACECNK